MAISAPIFIVGAGRSGTTILYKLLAVHPDLRWFSNITDRFPGLPFLPGIHRILDLPLIGRRLQKESFGRYRRKSLRIRPSEGGEHLS